MVTLPELADYAPAELAHLATESPAFARYGRLLEGTGLDPLYTKRHRAWMICAAATLTGPKLAKATTAYSNLDTESTNGALFDMVSKLNDPRHHGQNFWVKGKLKSMSTFQQQDAQEYYSKILDALEKEVLHEV